MPQYVGCRLVNVSVAPAAFFIREAARIAYARQHHPVSDFRGSLLIARQPCNCSDSSRYEQKAIGILERLCHELACEENSNGNPGEIVIAQRRMACVARDQDFIIP